MVYHSGYPGKEEILKDLARETPEERDAWRKERARNDEIVNKQDDEQRERALAADRASRRDRRVPRG